MRIGDEILIGSGSKEETNTIAGFGSINLETPLLNNHPAGTKVTKVLHVREPPAPVIEASPSPPTGGCVWTNNPAEICIYDPTCAEGGLGCNAGGHFLWRFCGFGLCDDPRASQTFL